MTHRNIIKLVLVFCVFSFLSCSEKEQPPEETCFDKIKNQNETEVDCGGECKPCPMHMTAKVNGNSWVADTATITASYSNAGTKFQLKGNAAGFYPQISLVYLGSLSLGSHSLDHSSSFSPDFNSATTFVTSGTLTISELDTRKNLVKGTFNFTSADASTTYSITEGTFINVPYKLN